MTFHLFEDTAQTFQCGIQDLCLLIHLDYVLPVLHTSFTTFPPVITKLSVFPKQAVFSLLCAFLPVWTALPHFSHTHPFEVRCHILCDTYFKSLLHSALGVLPSSEPHF